MLRKLAQIIELKPTVHSRGYIPVAGRGYYRYADDVPILTLEYNIIRPFTEIRYLRWRGLFGPSYGADTAKMLVVQVSYPNSIAIGTCFFTSAMQDVLDGVLDVQWAHFRHVNLVLSGFRPQEPSAPAGLFGPITYLLLTRHRFTFQ